MPILSSKAVMKSRASVLSLAAIALVSCSSRPEATGVMNEGPAVMKVDKPFVSAGTIEMQLDGGGYVIRAGTDEHIRVSFTGNAGNARADLDISGTHANLAVKDTPHSGFRATVEVPPAADLTVHLTGGNLEVGAITGNKDIDSKAGNVAIAIPNRDDYRTVEASVRAGNLNGGPFGNSGSGFSPHLKWSGPGKYTLRADLGAGDLQLKK